MSTQKLIDSKSLCLLAAYVLPLCLALTSPCAASTSAHHTARASQVLQASTNLTDDPPDIFFPKLPPPPPPPQRA